MSAQSLGKISVVVGTPTRITNGQSDPTKTLSCNSIMVQTLSSSAALVWVGLSNIDITTGIGVLAVLAIPTANNIPSFSMGNPTAMAAFNAAEIYIAGTSTTSGVIASIIK